MKALEYAHVCQAQYVSSFNLHPLIGPSSVAGLEGNDVVWLCAHHPPIPVIVLSARRRP